MGNTVNQNELVLSRKIFITNELLYQLSYFGLAIKKLELFFEAELCERKQKDAQKLKGIQASSLPPPSGGAVVKYRRALEINDYDA